MDVETVATLFAVLLAAGIVGAAALVLSRELRRRVQPAVPALMATVAVGATAGSLYFSEIADFVPCEMCWFQRIAMYPLAVLLTIAAVRGDRAIVPYALVLAALGLAVSLYHIQLQLFPEQSTVCSFTSPCTAKWVEAFGFMTIPQMAATAFVVLIVLSTIVLAADRHSSPDRDIAASRSV